MYASFSGLGCLIVILLLVLIFGLIFKFIFFIASPTVILTIILIYIIYKYFRDKDDSNTDSRNDEDYVYLDENDNEIKK